MSMLFRQMQRLFCLFTSAGLVACAAPKAVPVPPQSAFKQARPASVLVLPPLNNTPDVLATASVLSQLTYPLAEAGFYVLPVSLVNETLRQNGVLSAADAQHITAAKLRDIFGADAVLYVQVTRYGSVYKVLSSEAAVTLNARLVDLRSGELLWSGQASASSAEQGGANQFGLIGLVVAALVQQIGDSVSDRSHPLAALASQRLLAAGRPGGLLYGPRSPKYGAEP
jgi:adhesin HecA-like repeat protein